MTTYTLNETTGIVTRDDGVVVSPTQSDTDPDFLAYTTWLGEGNTPNVVNVPGMPENLYISRRAFRDRFTMDEKIALELISSDNHTATLQERQVSAAVRAMLKDVDNSQYIDLESDSLQAGMAMLVGFGVITQDRSTAILSLVIAQEERP